MKTLPNRVPTLKPRIATMEPGSWRAGKQSHERGYDHQWRRERGRYLKLNPLCVMCAQLDIVSQAEVVDHIIPHRGDMVLFWQRSNWQSLCRPHHDRDKQRDENAAVEPELP